MPNLLPIASRIVILAVVVVGCNHTDVPGLPMYGATGPRVPGPEALLSGGNRDETWTEDGGGIFGLGQCTTNQTASGPVAAPAMTLLPRTGGSRIWEKCDVEISTRFPGDSIPRFHAAALGSGGQLIYVESVQWKTSGAPLPFPVAAPTVLWLSDSGYPFSRRRKLLPLYRDNLGVATVPGDSVNWLTNIAWAGPERFVARGANIRPDESLNNLGLVRGEIDASGATLHRITGAKDALIYSLAEDNATIVFNRDPLIVESVALADGPSRIVGHIPTGSHRVIVGISCKGETCYILTQEASGSGTTQSTVWTLSLPTAQLTVLRVFSTSINSFLISPSSDAVLVGSGNSAYLYTDVFAH